MTLSILHVLHIAPWCSAVQRRRYDSAMDRTVLELLLWKDLMERRHRRVHYAASGRKVRFPDRSIGRVFNEEGPRECSEATKFFVRPREIRILIGHRNAEDRWTRRSLNRESLKLPADSFED